MSEESTIGVSTRFRGTGMLSRPAGYRGKKGLEELGHDIQVEVEVETQYSTCTVV